MPCYDSRSDLNTNEGYQLHRQELEREWMHNSRLAEMLCTLCKAYMDVTDDELPESIVPWWKAHLERDRVRRKNHEIDEIRKAKRAKALAKLTKAERKLLDL